MNSSKTVFYLIAAMLMPAPLWGMASEFDTDESLAFTWFARPPADEDRVCVTCTKPASESKCGKCGTAYCTRACQLKHWPAHKKACSMIIKANNGDCQAMRTICNAWITVANCEERMKEIAAKRARAWYHRLVARLLQEKACLVEPAVPPMYTELIKDEMPRIVLLLADLEKPTQLIDGHERAIFWVRDLTEQGLLPDEPQIPGAMIPENERYYRRIAKLYMLEEVSREKKQEEELLAK